MSVESQSAPTVTAVNPLATDSPMPNRFFTLPDGSEIACQSQSEAEHMYEDLFVHRIYLSHGITLWDGATVVDVGGNIGLFTLFVHRHYRDARTYTFEPAPPLFEILTWNVGRCGGDARLYNCGVSDRSGTASLTFYPYSSGMSSFHGDEQEEKDVLRRILENQRKAGEKEIDRLLPLADDFLDARFTKERFDCPLVPLSLVIRQEGLERIDLLKIDVQKSELQVLGGIDGRDWPKIRQIVMEVHDLDGQLRTAVEVLEDKGFVVVVDQDPLYVGSVMYNLFAVHDSLYRSTGRTASAKPRIDRQKEAYSRLRRKARSPRSGA